MRTLFTIALLQLFLFSAYSLHAQTIDTALSEIKQNGSWQNSRMFIYAYDANCRNTNSLFENWDTIAHAWVPSTQGKFLYSSDGKIQERLYLSWDDVNKVWINGSKETHTYNDAGNTELFTLQFWDSYSNTWSNYYRTVDTLDSEGRITSLLFSLYFGFWQVVSRDIYKYDTQGRLASLRIDSKNNNEWGHGNLDLYSYDDVNYHEKLFIKYWDASTNQWILSYKRFSNLLQGTLLSTSSRTESVIAGQWQITDRDSQTYNANNKFTSAISQYKDGAIWITSSKSKQDYYNDGSIHTLNNEYLSGGTYYEERTTYTHHGCILQLQRAKEENNETKNTAKMINDHIVPTYNGKDGKTNSRTSVLYHPGVNRYANSIVYDELIAGGPKDKNITYHNILTAVPALKASAAVSTNIVATNNTFSVTPNPAKNFIMVSNNSKTFLPAQQTLKLTDLSGKTLLTKTLQNTATQKVSLPSLPPGTYVVTIATAKGIQSNLLLIQ